jgi:exopolysaccharide biosynthesis polyprenyl glycosylphosphotransferase
LRNIRQNPRWGYEVIGFLSRHEENQKEINGLPVLGDISRLEEVLEKKRPDEVVLAIAGLSHEKMVQLIAECEKYLALFKLVPDMFEIITSKVDIFDIDGIPLLGLKELPLEYAWNRFVKRVVDMVGSVIGLIISAPLYIVIAPLIKFTSPGPVFYKQARCGEDGRGFTLYKFRTMYQDAEQKTGPVWAKVDDPRCTWVGKFLRGFYLDELPQLINVLKGDMSLVGPRPERPSFVEQFKDDIPRYMSRHLVKSGVTGWSQVNGLRGNTPLRERIKYDMYYIENWSIWFDLKILFMTIFAKKNLPQRTQG